MTIVTVGSSLEEESAGICRTTTKWTECQTSYPSVARPPESTDGKDSTFVSSQPHTRVVVSKTRSTRLSRGVEVGESVDDDMRKQSLRGDS